MTLQHIRPEDRSRQGVDSPVWADTLPACWRSEGFAEDLPEPTTGLPVAAGESGSARVRDITLPMLGVALAGMLGVFAR